MKGGSNCLEYIGIVKCWNSNSMEARGFIKERLELTPMGPFDVEQEGASTPDLIVVEFRKGCGQMDLASACVLHPLNRLVLDFEVGSLGGQTSGGPGVYQTRDGGED